ncbi:MAG TPA: HlyD family efflux transporter periplasmic adaptor subunit, partial [Rhodocyclaceae bacterium]|nr:HlyD family efflux transporter periplasmic adaptor subunit [Rhodocyclaceae bacterium]
MRPAGTLAAILLAALSAGCERAGPSGFQGYAEGEFVLVASPYAGTLERLAVARGQQVAAGAALFALESAAEQAAVGEAEARVGTARERLANLEAARRKPEIEALQAQVASAAAERRLAVEQLKQQERLRRAGYVSQSRLDEAQAAHDRAAARVEEAEAQLRNARAGIGREAEIGAARTELQAAQAQLAQARWRLEQKSAAAPAAALVQDTFFSQGEWVPAGAPIVSLLPPGNIKLRFFVPETAVGAIRAGQPVSITCDGCGAPIAATVSFVSAQPEYTPPVIYSRESRAKL